MSKSAEEILADAAARWEARPYYVLTAEYLTGALGYPGVYRACVDDDQGEITIGVQGMLWEFADSELEELRTYMQERAEPGFRVKVVRSTVDPDTDTSRFLRPGETPSFDVAAITEAAS